ncbi:hypothetical protein [Burkholderia sp. ABCPW 14]|uniref:hypothetical protein n=1 Tax=Burkholderia sp. ABCPW 14 TaxID=1637860 RepID=UPI0018D237BB|nr:hypothetical protein [Burkholderia sp. ABCPW 14]
MEIGISNCFGLFSISHRQRCHCGCRSMIGRRRAHPIAGAFLCRNAPSHPRDDHAPIQDGWPVSKMADMRFLPRFLRSRFDVSVRFECLLHSCGAYRFQTEIGCDGDGSALHDGAFAALLKR